MKRLLGLTFLCAAAQLAHGSMVIPHNFSAYNSSVAGYQDSFLGTTFNAGWEEVSVSGGTYVAGSSGGFALPGDGTLHMNGSGRYKLLYSGGTYSSTAQTVLALIQATNLPNENDHWRGGVTVATSPADGHGYNALLSSHGGSPGDSLLNDDIAWGNSGGTFTSGSGVYPSGTYYWLLVTDDGSNNVTTKLWPADGSTPEPASATATNNGFGTRSGLAGLTTDIGGGTGNFQVAYVLIESAGLPTIMAGIIPEPATLALLCVGGAGLLFGRRRT